MSVTELGTRVRLSDPKPAHCSACLRGAERNVKFVDFDAAYDNPTVVDGQSAILWGSDDLHLCESCVKAAVEVLGLKAELHSRQMREIRRLEMAAEHWREYALSIEAALAGRPDISERPKMPPSRGAGGVSR